MDTNDLVLGTYNMIGQMGQAAMSYGTHKADRKFNAEQARLNREWQEKMWNLANEYNTPVQQMQRLSEAGLNPNLVYGEGATTLAAHVGNGSSASAPVDRIQYPDLASALMMGKQLQESQSRTDLNNALELKAREEAKKVGEETKGFGIENMFKRDSYQLRLDQLVAESNLKDALANTEVSKRNEIQANIDHLTKQDEYLENEMWNKSRLTNQEILKLQNDMTNANKVTAATVTKLNADARKANADAWLASAEAAIKSNPRYQNAKVNEAVYDAYKALQEGNEVAIQYRLSVLQESLMPELGSAAFEWRKWWDNWVGAPAGSIGKILGGNVGVTKKF